MINLHIKGDLAIAIKQCDKRRIELMAVQCRYRAGIAECFASCADNAQNRDQVRYWYHEDADIIDGFGYPKGTLLHFSHE